MVPNDFNYMPLIFRPYYHIMDKYMGHLRHYNSSELIKFFKSLKYSLINLSYSAHYIKILQFVLTIPFKHLLKKDSKLWWTLENKDLSQKNNKNALHFSIVF